MNIIELSGVTKKFGRFEALKSIDLTVRKGEILGFIGPNGAGKSTTIKTLLGVLKATSGEAKVFGMDSWKDTVEIHKRIAYVPGDVNLWPNLTGGEVIDLFMSLQGSPAIEKRDELIRRFDLDPTKKCRTYSKGNRQKIALIAAFASNAELFILDEPTSGLDPLMERVFQEYVEEAKAQGKTVLLSSHILSEVEKLCDRITIIREGKIVETGSLKEMRHLTRTLLTVATKLPVPDLEQQEGVHDFTGTNTAFSFQVDTEKLSGVIQYLSPFTVLKLESTPPTLEDLFMRHYEDKKGNLEGDY
ncbi:ABC transporter ATP-binding protein [Enterococcus sp. CWB-B31]|uniref:ABC transporter ATP-binding protein n=1 Tax=Enterococcus sp. CWB-B31 TaxID=2885159 RepID=UPI001E361824|nr:ABC transporter ATP-binding protein [Enterococcus sp. CWB-B31]MCB5953471.1 ABC transporter ATP-binding protein [Enterococcus sp. CWB-B31]